MTQRWSLDFSFKTVRCWCFGFALPKSSITPKHTAIHCPLHLLFTHATQSLFIFFSLMLLLLMEDDEHCASMHTAHIDTGHIRNIVEWVVLSDIFVVCILWYVIRYSHRVYVHFNNDITLWSTFALWMLRLLPHLCDFQLKKNSLWRQASVNSNQY